jgi:hypothetical protein
MQQHPIPQDITGYRFHIIGSMTLKQFGEVFLGVIVAVIFFSTNLIVIVKWPLIVLSVGMGVVAAFVPIQERPLDHWISTFIKIMYKPTKFFWKRNTKVPELFSFESSASTIIQEPEIDLTPAKRQRIKEYLGSVPEASSFSTDFSENDISQMKNILSLFGTTTNSGSEQAHSRPKKEKPNIGVRVRSMRIQKKSEDISEEVGVFDTSVSQTPESEITPSKTEENKTREPIKKVILSSDQVAEKIQIPKPTTIKLETDIKTQDEQVVGTSSTHLSKKTFIESKKSIPKDIGVTKDINFNSGLPFPVKPTEPNKLVGMVLSQNNDLLTNSIVEVQTKDGQIERAVKTNALGQFFITTPLKNGDYTIIVEKENYTFQPLNIKIDGTIIQPVEIRSKN